MNYIDKITERKRILGLFRQSYNEGCIKITSQESELHARVKCQVAYWLKKSNYSIWCEPNFKGNLGRPDLLGLHSSGIAYIFEIVSSESEKSIEEKRKKYPIPLIIVNVKDFKYNEFKL